MRSIYALSLAILAISPIAAQRRGFGGPQVPENLQFRFMGPAVGNRIAAVAGVPGDNSTYYVGASSGGVWKTTDGGARWSPIFDKESAQAIGALAVAPSDHKIVWAGTGEAWVIRDVDMMGNGIYKSTDSGATWQHMGLTETGRIGRIIVHPSNPDIVYACAVGRATGPQQERGVFRTKDGGKTWQDVTPPQPAPASGSTLQASGAFRDAATAWVVYSLAGSGPADAFTLIWSTRDGGATWSYFSLDTTSIGAEFFIPSNMTFVDAQHGWFLAHVGAGMMHDYVAILATGDGGVSWQALLDPNSDGGIQSCGKNAMAFADTQTGWLTPDCDGVDPVPHLFKTGDGGSTWQRIDLQAPSGAPAGFLDNNACGMHDPVLFSAASAVFAMKCKDTATFTVEKDYLYSTSDGGQTWQTTALPSDFTVLAEPAGGLFFPSAGAGLALSRKIYATADGGKTWSLAKLVNWDGQFDFLDLKTGWAVARNSGQIALVATTDGGGTWQQLKPTVAP